MRSERESLKKISSNILLMRSVSSESAKKYCKKFTNSLPHDKMYAVLRFGNDLYFSVRKKFSTVIQGTKPTGK